MVSYIVGLSIFALTLTGLTRIWNKYEYVLPQVQQPPAYRRRKNCSLQLSFCKEECGTFILRIEDTDQARFVEGAEEYIMESLEWCGIVVDEGIREEEIMPLSPERPEDNIQTVCRYLVEKGMPIMLLILRKLESLRSESEKAEKHLFIMLKYGKN